MIPSRAFCFVKNARNSTRILLDRRFVSTCPLTIKPSQDELFHGRLTSRNLEKAVRSLHEDGLVVIENAIPHKDLDHLNVKMVQDALHLQSRGKNMPFNYNVGNSMRSLLPLHSRLVKTILTTIVSPARPATNERLLRSLDFPEPSRHAVNKHPPRPMPQMDFLLR